MTRRDRAGPSQRQLRVAELLRHAMAGILAREEMRDADLAGVSVTVTGVDMSPDLRNATVYVMPLGGADGDVILRALRRRAPYLRGRMAKQITLKYSPRLMFEVDTSFDEANRIEALLRSPRVAQDLKREPDSE